MTIKRSSQDSNFASPVVQESKRSLRRELILVTMSLARSRLQFSVVLSCMLLSMDISNVGTIYLDNAHLSSSFLHLPVKLTFKNIKSAFFLQNNRQGNEGNASLQMHTQHILIVGSTSGDPGVNVSYGPYSQGQTFHRNPLSLPNTFQQAYRALRDTWSLQALVTEEDVFSDWPTVQVLFYISGKDWGDRQVHGLPCVQMYAVYKIQKIRTSCKLQGELSMCLAKVIMPLMWFEKETQHSGNTSGKSTNERLPVKIEVNLYATMEHTEGHDTCERDDRVNENVFLMPHKVNEDYFKQHFEMIGRVFLHPPDDPSPLEEIRLNDRVVIYLPSIPANPQDVLSIPLGLLHNYTVEHLTIRVQSSHGVSFLAVLPSNPTLYDVSTEIIHGGNISSVKLQIHRKKGAPLERAPSTLEIARIELRVQNMSSVRRAVRRLTWLVEPTGRDLPYPPEVNTDIPFSPSGIRSIVPLAMSHELVNTAVLTGKMVKLPLRVVAIYSNGRVTDVSQHAECVSLDKDIIKVTESCDYVYVDGRESAGSTRAHIQVTHEHLRAGLELAVWLPRLPLHIQLSHSQLGQVKGWRVPISYSTRSTGGINSKGRKSNVRGCTLQSQHTPLNVLTQFCATSPQETGDLTLMLDPEWLVDVTDLVQGHMFVEDTRIAQLKDGKTLIGHRPGMTAIQIISPVSDMILGERAVTVSEQKVSISELHVQVVSGLSLSLHPRSNARGIMEATTTTKEVLQTYKQEAVLSVWLGFSDGSVTPLDVYNPQDYSLSVSSLDKEAVSIRHFSSNAWPSVVAEGNGQGGLVKVKLMISNSCQKSKRRSTLAVSFPGVRVRFDRNATMPSIKGRVNPGEETHVGDDDVFDLEQNTSVTTQEKSVDNQEKTQLGLPEIVKKQLASEETYIRENMTALTINNWVVPTVLYNSTINSDQTVGQQLSNSHKSLSDLQVGMYTLLSVFLLTFCVFLINCGFLAVRHKLRLNRQAQGETISHPHISIELQDREEAGRVEVARDAAHMSRENGGFYVERHCYRTNSDNLSYSPLDALPDESEAEGTSVTFKKRVKFSLFTEVRE
ncbi:transmembrane protein 132D-like isoform X2 [Petromyzon marinus]|uniref:transmembrane protein 132D-like isoform X2 n=1 Tax=Petromyzon marinus TaxID=7757 RepID=UPI003F6FE7EA